ncbi:MAG: hypothetical protein LBI45_04720 [Bacteroidales bacterium]|nr:hypothetical protein [Bacteroidales bacterium]
MQRSKEIKARLITIRAAQIVYRCEYKNYLDNLDSLVEFANNGMVHIVKISGNIPEEMTENEALRQGLIKKTVEICPAKTRIVNSDPNVTEESLKNFHLIPHTNNKKFEIQTGEIYGKTYTIPVFRIEVPLEDIFANSDQTISNKTINFWGFLFNKMFYNNLDKDIQYIANYSPLWLGSLTGASTSGSWE